MGDCSSNTKNLRVGGCQVKELEWFNYPRASTHYTDAKLAVRVTASTFRSCFVDNDGEVFC